MTDPEYGEITVQRTLEQGIRILTAPARSSITLECLAYGAVSFPQPGVVLLAGQVAYRVTGWEPANNSLTVELVHDGRPEEPK